MVSKLEPEFGKVYFINQYTMFHVLKGSGVIQVDFKNHADWNDKLIFLDRGQYIKFLSHDFVVRKIVFTDQEKFKNKDYRVLFKHLVSLGYINFSECCECQGYLNQTTFNNNLEGIIDVSSKQWFWQNPFGASKEQYHLIFNVKSIIDAEFKNNLNESELVKILDFQGLNSHALFKNKVGLTIGAAVRRKRLLESQHQVAFANKSLKEISYELGFKDPSYFARQFKQQVGVSPNVFRQDQGHRLDNKFVSNVLELVKEFHTKQRQVSFYSNKLSTSSKTLSNKVKQELQLSIGQLIRMEIVNTATQLLKNGAAVKDVAQILHFEESHHFTSFYKKYAGITPSQVS